MHAEPDCVFCGIVAETSQWPAADGSYPDSRAGQRRNPITL